MRTLGGAIVLLLLAWGLSTLVGPRVAPPTSPDTPDLVGVGGPAPAPAPLAGSSHERTAPTRPAGTSPAPMGTTPTPARTVTLRGTVTDATGAVVAGADVAARPGLAVHVNTTSDAEGRFAMEVPANSTCALRARHHCVGRAERVGLDVADAGLDVGSIVLVPAGILEGTVVLSDDSTVPWGSVWADYVGADGSTSDARTAQSTAPRWEWPSSAPFVWLQADRDGRFVARDLSPGSYALVGRANLHFPSSLGRPAYPPERTARTDATGLRVLCEHRVLVLRVHDAAGAPIARGTVRIAKLDDVGAVIDASTFRFRDGIGAVELDGMDRLAIRAETEDSESDEVELRIEAAGPVRVERALTLHPLAAPGQVRIQARPSSTPVRRYFVRATELRVDGTPGIGGASFVVDAGAPSPLLRAGRWRLEVFPGAENEFRRLRDFAGASPPSGTVIPPLAAEVHEVLVPAGGEGTAQAADGEAGFLRAMLHDAATFEGVTRDVVVRAADRRSGARWTGFWSSPDRPGRWRGFGAGGPQEFSVPLAPGAYVLDVTMRGRGSASVPFEIRAGATTDVEVEIEPTVAKDK